MRRKLLSCLLTMCMLFTLLPTAALAADANPFTDVKDADWFYDGVLWAEDEGLMNGTAATTFAPNDTTTRGMLVTILWRLAGKPDAKGTQFSDVDDGAYYADATIWGCANDIICGYGDGTFGPNDAITRQQMATILYRYAKYAKYDVTAAADLSDYDDADEVASWAEDALAWANAEGLINGMGDGTLAPAGNATRAQVAAILYRMTKLSPAKEETKPSTSGGSSSGGSSHTHDWVWTSNRDGTHSAVCSKNSSHTKAAEDCDLHGYEACTVCGYTDSKYHIANVDDLLAFAALVNADTDKFAFEGETAVLDADIDMTGRTWTPIEKVFNGTFDGQGNTISNLTIKGTEKVGLFGSAWLASEIKDVNFETVTVTGNHFVGTVVGSTYGTVSGCSVTDLTMTVEPDGEEGSYDNGDKVGGIAGYSACGKITDCSVTDATISAYRDVGGILGASIKDNINTTVTDCTVENVTINVNQDGEKNYGTKAPNAGGIVGRVDGSVDTTSCTQTNVTINVTLGGTDAKAVAMIGSKAYSTLEAALAEVKAGDTLTMLEDATVSAGSGSYGKVGLTVNGWTLDGAGNTLSVTGADNTWDCGIYITSGTVKNLTVSDSFRGIFSGACDGDIAIDNVTFKNVCYTFNSGASKADSSLTVTNSALNGWTSYTSGYESVSFTNCTFSKGTGGYTYEFLRAYSDTTITDCTFVGDFQIGSNDSAITITINNSTIDDGRSIFDLFDWSDLNGTTVVVDGTYYVGTGAQLKALIEGFEDGTEATIALAGTEYTTTEAISVGGGKNITIQGVEGTRLTTWFKVTADLKLQDLTLVSPSAAVPGETISQYKYSTISLMNEGDVVCENVTFDMGEAVADATAITAWWSTGEGANIVVKNSTFNCAGNRPIRSDACVTVESCEFNDPYRYAVQMTSKSSTMAEDAEAFVKFNNNTINAGTTSDKPVYGVQLEGDYGCSELTINGKGNTIDLGKTGKESAMYYCECGAVDHATTVWNTEVPPVHEDEQYSAGLLAELYKALKDGKDVTLPEDVSGAAVSGGYNKAGLLHNGSTIDGNGNTLTISDANNTWDCAIYTTGGTIKNLTIGGAFRGIFTADLNEDLVVDNCIIENVCYPFNSDGANKNYSVIFKDTTLNGWTSYDGDYKSVSFTDCTFGKGPDGYPYAYLRPYSDTTLTGCAFSEGYQLDATRTDCIVLENCTVGGEDLTIYNLVDLLGDDAAKAIVNGQKLLADGLVYDEATKTVKFTNEAIDAEGLESVLESVSSMTDVTLSVEGVELGWETGAGLGSTPLVAKDALVKTIIIDGGDEGATLTATGAGVGSIRAANDGTLVFKNVTFVDDSESYAEDSWEFAYLEMGGKLEFENCTFSDPIQLDTDAEATFTNCTFTGKTVDGLNMYGVWMSDGSATFTNCEFTGTRGLKAHEAYGTDVTKVIINGCTFTLSEKPGLAIGDVDKNTIITIINSEFTCQPGDQNLYIYETDTDVDTFTFSQSDNTINE